MEAERESHLFSFCNNNNNNNNNNVNNNGSLIGNVLETPTVKTLDKSIFILALALGISLFILSLACLVFNCLLRKNRILKMSSPRLNMVIASGGILASVCCVLEGTDYFLVVDSSPSHFVCHVRYCLLTVSFSLVYGPMVGRTWRVNRIFKLAGYKRVVIRDHNLLLYTAVLIFLDVAICVAWFLVDPLEFQDTTHLTKTAPCDIYSTDIIVTQSCTSKWPTLWVALFLATKLPFLIFGLRESWWTKGDILPTINDSTALVVSILAAVTMATIAAMTSQTFLAYPDVAKGCTVGCLWIAGVFAIAAVFIPKLLLWKRTPNGRVSRVSISSTSSTKAVLQSFGQLEAELTTANSEIETLKDFIREKENSITKLQRLLSDAEDNLTQFNNDNVMTSQSLDQSQHGNSATSSNVKGGVLWLNEDHADCPGLQDHEEFCSCNSSVDNEKQNNNIIMNIRNTPNNTTINTNNNNTTNDNTILILSEPQQQPLKSILHITGQENTFSTNNTSKSADYNDTNENSRHLKSSFENNNNNNNTFNDNNNNSSHWKSYDQHYGQNPNGIHSQNTQNNNNITNNKLSVMEKPILKRCTSPIHSYHYHNKNSSSNTGSNALTSNDTNNRMVNTKNYNSPSSNNSIIRPPDYVGGPLLFDPRNETNQSLTALQKRFLRRRRSSTSSIANMSKLNRLRSDLSDALQLSQALGSGWCKDFGDMERYKRQVKMARRARRKSVPGFQNITESIMASYDFQRTADNETFISDCLSTSEWSSDINTRNSKTSSVSSSQGSKSLNRGRRHSECNFYFPYDRSGRLDDFNIRMDVINNSSDYTNAPNSREFDFNVIPTINEPIRGNYDVRGQSGRGEFPLGTISGRIGPAALYGRPDYDGFDRFPDRVYPDVFAQKFSELETASDFLAPTTPRPVLTSDSLYPPPERVRRWSGGPEGARRKDDSEFYRGGRGGVIRGGGGVVREREVDRRIMIGRDLRLDTVNDNNEFLEDAAVLGPRGDKMGCKNTRPFHLGERDDNGVHVTTYAIPNIRVGNCNNPKGNVVTFADNMVVTTSEMDLKRSGFNDNGSFTASGAENSLQVRPKFHRSVSDNILSRRNSRGEASHSLDYHDDVRRKEQGLKNSGSVEHFRPQNERMVMKNDKNGKSRPRETTVDIRNIDRRQPELSTLTKDSMPAAVHCYTKNKRGRTSPQNMTYYRPCQYEGSRKDDEDSQISIKVTVGGGRQRDNRNHSHGNWQGGGEHRQSFA